MVIVGDDQSLARILFGVWSVSVEHILSTQTQRYAKSDSVDCSNLILRNLLF